MSLRRSLVLVLLVACGGAEQRDATAPGEVAIGCPSSAAPERCRDLATAAASSGNGQLAWAYTVLECESPTAAQCTVMWQRFAKSAPTQTDALNVLHAACDHEPTACEQMAAWHTERGHVLAAAAYQKRVDAARHARGDGSAAPPSRSTNALALATDLAALMHVSGPPRTEAIAQMVSHEVKAPVAHDVAKQRPKAWPMHAGASTHSDGCASDALRDRHKVPLEQCVTEVRPFDGDQIAILNRCSEPINVAYMGAPGDRASVANQLRLDSHEAHSIGISHRDVGTLTYAVCSDGCRITGSDTTRWAAPDAFYNCSK